MNIQSLPSVKRISYILTFSIGLWIMHTQHASESLSLHAQAIRMCKKHATHNDSHECHAGEFHFTNVIELEEWIYSKILQLRNGGWDYHDILIRFRPQLRYYLAFLVMHWDNIENRETLVFNTPAFNWQEIKDYYGNDYEEYTYHFNTICEKIAEYYDNPSCYLEKMK